MLEFIQLMTDGGTQSRYHLRTENPRVVPFRLGSSIYLGYMHWLLLNNVWTALVDKLMICSRRNHSHCPTASYLVSSIPRDPAQNPTVQAPARRGTVGLRGTTACGSFPSLRHVCPRRSQLGAS